MTNRFNGLFLITTLRSDGAAEKALNITSTGLGFTSNMYFIVIAIGGYIKDVLLVQGYTDSTTFEKLTGERAVKIYESTAHPISEISAINNGQTVRTKIIMKNADKSYRAYITPLGYMAAMGLATYSADWATS